MPTINAWGSQDPAQVAKGGTGDSSFTAYALIAGGTTTTNPLQSLTSGTSGQMLKSNGNAALPTWVTTTSGTFSIVSQVFTTTSTYTPTSGMVYCILEVVGGGGGSGGCPTTDAAHISGAGNGGGGGYASLVVSAATIGVSQAVTIGAGGTAGAAGANAGGTGGTTSVGALVSATGGVGGAAGGQFGTGGSVFGGVGGTGASGNYNLTGSSGGATSGIFTANIIWQDISGSSILGGGISRSPAGAAATPTTYGAGAAGGSIGAGTGQIAGAAGAPGIVIITEYVFS